MRQKSRNETVLIRERVGVPNFVIDEDVFGVPLEFDLGAVQIQIVVPDDRESEKSEEEKPATYGSVEFADGRKTNHYVVPNIELVATSPKQIRLPDVARQAHPRHEEYFSKKQIATMDCCLEDLREVGNRAISYWLDMCRWVTGFERYGNVPRDFLAYMPDPALRIGDTDHRFWCLRITPNRILHVMPSISSDRWREIGNRLQAGRSVPVWCSYIFEAQSRLFRRDFRGAILIGAIACETLIRHCFLIDLGTVKGNAAVQIADAVNVRSILNRINELDSLQGLEKSAYSSTKLQTLFNLRNDEIHSAKLNQSGQDKIAGIIDNARLFIDLVHKHLEQAQGGRVE